MIAALAALDGLILCSGFLVSEWGGAPDKQVFEPSREEAGSQSTSMRQQVSHAEGASDG